MAKAVIDMLKVIQIQEDQQEGMLGPLVLLDRLFKSLGEQESVWQACQHVVVSEVVEFSLGLFEVGNIRKNSDVVCGGTLLITYTADVLQLGIDRAVFATIPDLTSPSSCCVKCFP